MDSIDLKVKVFTSSADDVTKDTLSKYIDKFEAYNESAKGNKIDKADADLWKKTLVDSGNSFKQCVATINQLRKGTNEKALQQKLREARKILATMDSAISGVTGNQQVWTITKRIVVGSKIDPEMSKKADKVLKDAKKLQNGDIYSSAASRLLDLCSNCLDSFEVKTK